VAQVDRDIEDRAGEAAHQLALCVRRGLEMKAAHSARRSAVRLVVLHESGRANLGREQVGTEHLGKVAARVAVDAGAELDQPGYVEASNFHRIHRPRRSFRKQAVESLSPLDGMQRPAKRGNGLPAPAACASSRGVWSGFGSLPGSGQPQPARRSPATEAGAPGTGWSGQMPRVS
jgi:hypothetical protein